MAPKTKNGSTSRLLAKMIGMTPAWLTMQRQELAGAAEDAPAADVLGRLRRDAPLPLGDGDDGHHHGDEQDDQHDDLLEADVLAAAAAQRADDLPVELAGLEEQRRRGRRHAGDDAGHDDEADAVADAVLVDLLADPHQEDGAGRHGDDHGQASRSHGVVVSRQGQPDAAWPARSAHDVLDVHEGLEEADEDGGVAGVFVDLLAAALAFLLQLLQRRIDGAEQLEDDGRGDVGHDAQAEDGALAQVAAAEHRHEVEDVAERPAAADALVDLVLVDERQRDGVADAVDGQEQQREARSSAAAPGW